MITAFEILAFVTGFILGGICMGLFLGYHPHYEEEDNGIR